MALLQLCGSHIGQSPQRPERYTAPPEISSGLTCSPQSSATVALTKRSRTPGSPTCDMADITVTMKQY